MNKRLMAKGIYSIVIAIVILIMGDLLPVMVVGGPLMTGRVTMFSGALTFGNSVDYSIIGLTIFTRLFTYCGYGIGAIGLVLLHAGLLRDDSHHDQHPD